MNTVTLKPSPTATKWTKDRLKRHTGDFVEQDKSSIPHNGKDCILFQNVGDNWLGWIPISEIIITKNMLGSSD